MTVHLFREIENLKRKILAMGALAEESVVNAVQSLSTGDLKLAQQVIEKDDEIDLQEVEIEEDCLKVLALHQPVAGDLRYIIAIMKINNDLERIADLAVNIAECSMIISNYSVPEIPFDFQGMSRKAREMLRLALDSLINKDAKLARQVCAMDDTVDELHRQMFDRIEKKICSNNSQKVKVSEMLRFVTVSRDLERIADHSTNIAEDVIYLVEGIIFRHQTDYLDIS